MSKSIGPGWVGTHIGAWCAGCKREWDADDVAPDTRRIQNVKASIRRHVRSTGHEVGYDVTRFYRLERES